jgi:NAD(P)-dependent dehydrogenase (short-subunit alcohol dehydrogenase family)
MCQAAAVFAATGPRPGTLPGECEAGQGQQRGDPGLDRGARSPSAPWLARCTACRWSKTALNALTVLYAHTLADDGIKVNGLAPGLGRTDLNSTAGPPVRPSGLTLSTGKASSPCGPGPIGEAAQLADQG